MAKNNLTLIILAGGDGTRMRPASLITSKPLLTTFNESLLIRQIRQADEAGISKILISTNPKDYIQIKEALRVYKVKARVIKNEKHKEGSLPALNYAINKISTPMVLMSFADIYFLENPFPKFKGINKYSLGISKAFDRKELALGGIIFVKDKQVQNIVETPIKTNSKGYRWNGLTLFSKTDCDSLVEFLNLKRLNSPEGDFFEYLRTEKSIGFSAIVCSDFINVNRPDNLLVASMYRLSEVNRDTQLFSLANKVRAHILRNY